MSRLIEYYTVQRYDLRTKPYSKRLIGNFDTIEAARKELDSIAFWHRFSKPVRVGDKLYIKKPHGFVWGWSIEKSYRLASETTAYK